MRRNRSGRRRASAFAVLVITTVLTTTVSCEASDASDRFVALEVGSHTFEVEIADDPDERATGLMNRDELAPGRGMLFVFPEAAPRSFWMKNTRIPLSIAYINSRGEILEIRDMEPLSLDPVPSRYPAKYALEVNRGRFGQLGITAGTVVELADLPGWVEGR
jgi:uncharacterized membrane protein (UPF0127 family)